ncbi:hypothetical protein [Sphingosinicella sp. BN140058]|uniref:hypothetical protein n=1 Tax=Sphingosinicella sp. BN140058 TaxID=1892855 RepID=UPI001011B5AB|nr:hypothetical protein [Sphingosinicella sp. BN140058]QAY80321.1 hypothetical protein ETR14_27140 [Sphingosinicella sp. BN140058]
MSSAHLVAIVAVHHRHADAPTVIAALPALVDLLSQSPEERISIADMLGRRLDDLGILIVDPADHDDGRGIWLDRGCSQIEVAAAEMLAVVHCGTSKASNDQDHRESYLERNRAPRSPRRVR